MIQNSAGGGYIRDSLEKFIEICQSGEAPNHYKLHDKIIVPYGSSDKLTFEIVAMGVDTNGTTGSNNTVTLISKECLPETHNVSFYSWREDYCSYTYSNCSLKKLVEGSIFNSLPDQLKNAIVSTKKMYRGYYSNSFDILAGEDKGDTVYSCSPQGFNLTTKIWVPTSDDMSGNKYYESNEGKIKTLMGTDTPVTYTTACMTSNNSDSHNKDYRTYYYMTVDQNGLYGVSTTYPKDYYAPIGICIG